MINVEVASIRGIDLRGIELPAAVVYRHPRDYPNKYVCRIWDFSKMQPTPVCMVRETLEEIRKELRCSIFCAKIMRLEEDDQCIVETWI